MYDIVLIHVKFKGFFFFFSYPYHNTSQNPNLHLRSPLHTPLQAPCFLAPSRSTLKTRNPTYPTLLKFTNFPKFSTPFCFQNPLPVLLSPLISTVVPQLGRQKKMEKLNLALVSSPKPLMLGHVPARDVFRRKHFSFGRVLIAPHRCRFRVSALSSSHHNPKSGIQFLNFFLLFCFYVCVFFGGGIRVFCYNLCLVGKKIH